MRSQTISSDRALQTLGSAAPTPLPGHCAAEITIRTRYCVRHLANPEIAALVARSVENIFPILGIPVYAWCAMPDHLHLLISGVAPVDLPRIVYNFIHLTGELARRCFDIELWQWRHQRRIVDYDRLAALAKIIRDNPVRSGLTPPGGNYPWRSAPRIENQQHAERRCSTVC